MVSQICQRCKARNNHISYLLSDWNQQILRKRKIQMAKMILKLKDMSMAGYSQKALRSLMELKSSILLRMMVIMTIWRHSLVSLSWAFRANMLHHSNLCQLRGQIQTLQSNQLNQEVGAKASEKEASATTTTNTDQAKIPTTSKI